MAKKIQCLPTWLEVILMALVMVGTFNVILGAVKFSEHTYDLYQDVLAISDMEDGIYNNGWFLRTHSHPYYDLKTTENEKGESNGRKGLKRIRF